jgi:hypothetical protein
VNAENVPEFSVERLNEIMRVLLRDDTVEGAYVRDVLRGCLLDARIHEIECQNFKRTAKENEDEAIESKELAVKSLEELRIVESEIPTVTSRRV